MSRLASLFGSSREPNNGGDLARCLTPAGCLFRVSLISAAFLWRSALVEDAFRRALLSGISQLDDIACRFRQLNPY